MSKPVSKTFQDLRKLPCLSGLKDDELAVIGGQAGLKRFAKNDILFREADSVKFLFVIKSGRIKLFKTSPEGRELLIKIMGVHDYFCCAPLYLDKTYSVSAVALEDSEIVVIPVKEFKELIMAGISEMGMKIITGLCSRIKYMSGLVEDLSFKDVEQRIMVSLLRLAEEKAPDNNTVVLTVTHQDIAAMTGTVREVVSRAMSRLKKQGIIIDSNIKGFKIDRRKLSGSISEKSCNLSY